MNMQLFITFIIFNIINVIIQTIKSIATIKCGKVMAAIINALAYGLYTYIVILMVCELPTLVKASVIAFCNLVGVFLVKWLEEKTRKDKLWKVEVTVPAEYTKAIDSLLVDIPHSYIKISYKYTLFNFYCATQKESAEVKEIIADYNGRYFASETKIL